MRNLNVLAFCHGDYVTCKLNEIMNEDMKRLGYTSSETDAVARQAAVISVVPQDNLKKSSFTKIGFVSLDDYHYASDDASNLTDYYELDCCETSCFGIIEKPGKDVHACFTSTTCWITIPLKTNLPFGWARPKNCTKWTLILI